MKKNYKSILILVTLSIFFILSLFQSSMVIQNILDYSVLFLTKLFPVSFLFFILSNLLIEYGFVEIIQYYLPISMSSIYVFLISLISGFPSGVVCVSDLYQKGTLSKEEANHMLLFSHFPNPLFLFGTISTILGNNSLTIKLFLSIFISNTILFLNCHSSNNRSMMKIPQPKSFSIPLSQSIKKSFQLLEMIYGTSLFFYLIASFLLSMGNYSSFEYVFIYGIFDLTKGVFATSIFMSPIIRCFFILFFIQFGTISIHMQVKGILANSSLSYSSFILGRIIATIISFLILFLLIMGRIMY